MASPTNIDLSDIRPAAPAGYRNIAWLGGDPRLDPNEPDMQVRDVSAHLPNWGGVNAQSGTSYTVIAADRGKLISLSNASAIAVTLDTTLGSDFLCGMENLGAGTATLTPSSGTINGALSLALSANQGVLLFLNGTNWTAITGMAVGGGGGGTVTSVALTMPAEFSVAGSPVTSSGTLAVTKATEAANTFWAGPVSGAAASPGFRGIDVTDVPALPESKITGLTADLASKASLPTSVALTTPAGGGNFTVAHGLGHTPVACLIEMKSAGLIWFQTTTYDGTNLYLVGSDGGLTANAKVW